MTVFQAKNGYGNGCPWSCPYYGGNVSYEGSQYAVAQKHTDTHTGMTLPLRPPNKAEVAEQVAAAFHKVLNNLKEVEDVKL